MAAFRARGYAEYYLNTGGVYRGIVGEDDRGESDVVGAEEEEEAGRSVGPCRFFCSVLVVFILGHDR